MENSELNAMISLLDDRDNEIVRTITENLLSKGIEIIPELEIAWEEAIDERIQGKIEFLIQEIQFAAAKEDLRTWIRSGAQDILEGAFYVARMNYPDLSFQSINNLIEKIKNDVWLEINNNLTALEKVKILNYIIFEIHKFGRNQSDFYAPQNSYINLVIESKKGNPISLAIIYLSVAWKLGLPVYGVNLPKNFILAYKDEYRHHDAADEMEDVLFYINPYNKGAVLGRREIDHFITQQQMKMQKSYYLPCSNRDIVIRLISNLIVSYQKMGYVQKIERLKELLDIARD